MKGAYIDNNRLNECLNILFRNRLVWSTVGEYVEFFSYKALESNNTFSKIPYDRKLERFLLIEKENVLFGSGYSDLEELLRIYEATSEFFKEFIAGKPILRHPDAAFQIARSLNNTYSPSGSPDIDEVLNLLYDFELQRLRPTGASSDMLMLMILGVLPPRRSHSPKADPDYESEWRTVSHFIDQCFELNGTFEKHPTRQEIYRVLGERKNRLLFFWAVSMATGALDVASSPTELDSCNLMYDIDGLWQNINLETGEPYDRKAYYEFIKGENSYNFNEIVDYGTEIRYGIYGAGFVEDSDERNLFSLMHPKGSYEIIHGRKAPSDSLVRYTYSFLKKATPEILFSYHDGPKNFDVRLSCLRKVEEEVAQRLYGRWDQMKQINRFERYRCAYPDSQGIAAITREHIYVKDPFEDNCYYRIPKSIDRRLETITIDSMAGVLVVGDTPELWIGFEPISLYFASEEWGKNGIVELDRIG